MRNKYDVGVFFVGKYTNLIGPPKSMTELTSLLSSQYSVFSSKNLPVKGFGTSQDINLANVTQKGIFKKLFSILKTNRIIYELYILYLLCVFNLQIVIFHFLNPNAKIIITQPFFILGWLPSVRNLTIYIRRANTDWGVREKSAKACFVKKIFDYLFFRTSNIKLVYLVPQNFCSMKYSVIPNFFESSEWIIKNSANKDTNAFFVGTWCFRKGSDKFLSLFNESDVNVIPTVCGGLGSDSKLNSLLLKSKCIKYLGVVSNPSQLMYVGDIFISTSRVEGMQRSMVEAMLSGCLVVAISRPDSIFVSPSEGVFVVEHNCDEINEINEIIDKIINMSFERRSILGAANRSFIENNFSKSNVLSLWSGLIDD
jgi:hypothetical protein